MTIEQQIAALTTATTDLLNVVNVKKATLDAAVSDASNAAIATAADRVQTGLDVAATAADRIQTGLDRTQTGQDRVATAADRVQTGQDRVATAADRVQTGLDVAATLDYKEASEVAAAAALTHSQTAGEHRVAASGFADSAEQAKLSAESSASSILGAVDATAADRVQTGLDAAATSAAADAAAISEINAANFASASATSANNSAGSAVQAATSANNAATSATNASNSATDSATSATTALGHAQNAAAATRAALWVSGTTYAIGALVWSPINARVYRRLTAGAGTTDPSIDTTNWLVLSIVVEQSDIGTAPNEIPLNQYLGNLAFQDSNAVVLNPQASVVPAGIGDMVFQLTNNTTLVVKVKGSDGTVRSTTLTLA